MEEHSEGKSKSTACRRPFVCVFCEYYLSKSDALRREHYFKTTVGKRVLKLMLKESLGLVDAMKCESNAMRFSTSWRDIKEKKGS